jgi:AsmA protein
VAVTTDTQIKQVDVGAFVRAATRKEPPLAGRLDAIAYFTATGESPRALAQSLAGQLKADLGGIDSAAASGLTELDATVRLDGVDAPPQIAAGAVYNRQAVTVNVTTDSLNTVLGEDRFDADVAIASRLVNAAYEGTVLRAPAPGLDGNFSLDVTSVAELARWLDQPLPENQPDPGPLAVRATFAGSGETVRLEEATVEGRALRASASGSFDAAPAVPEFSLKAVVDEADLNAYLPKSSDKTKSAQKSPSQGGSGGGTAGWSEVPIDFSALGKANGEASLDFANVKYKDLVVERGSATMTLRDRVLEAVLDDVQTAEGSIAAEAGVDASASAAAVRYTASIANVQARPLLGGLEITDRIGGALAFTAEGNAQGRSEKELVSTLNGNGGFKFEDGAVYGVNLAATLRRARTLGISSSAAETQKTDFAELSGTFQITNGVLENRDLRMLAPLVRLTGAGTVPMPPRTVDYRAEAKLVSSLQGQGSADSLSGIPIPIHITGTWEKPAYNVDWTSVFRSVDPEDLANMPAELQDRAKDLGVDLPVDDIPGLDRIPDSTQEKVKDTLKDLFGR